VVAKGARKAPRSVAFQEKTKHGEFVREERSPHTDERGS
jgi:hypothetical protein